MNTKATADAYQTPVVPVPPRAALSPAQLLATVRQLYLEMQFGTPAARPFLERQIRGYADRYRACTRQEPDHDW